MSGKRGAGSDRPYRTAFDGEQPETSGHALLACEAQGLYIVENYIVQKGSTMPTANVPLRFSQFRANLFQIADAALASGEPVPLERNGRRLWLVPEGAGSADGSRLAQLPRRAVIVGNPEDLVDLNAAEWNENSNLG